jgi:voltage-gated potassium channel
MTRVQLGVALFAGVLVVGTTWYGLVEGFSFVNALFQTVTTIATVGFGEIEPLGDRGRLFTIGLIVVGVAVVAYTVSGVLEEFFERQLGKWGSRRVGHQIETLKGHLIICGFGRVGQSIAPLVRDRCGTVVVVDRDPDRCRAAFELGALAVDGDSTEDAVLERAGIRRAATLVVSLQSDADAISTVLSARVLNPDLRIVARANAQTNEAKLVRAGTDHVVNPLYLGATRLATFAMQPAVADFVDLVGPGPEGVRIEELVVPQGADAEFATLGDLRRADPNGALVVALRAPAGELVGNPDPSTRLVPGTTLIAIGEAQQLQALEGHLARH